MDNCEYCGSSNIRFDNLLVKHIFSRETNTNYYLTKKEPEADVPMNIMFIDIETYSGTKVLSNAVDADNEIVI